MHIKLKTLTTFLLLIIFIALLNIPIYETLNYISMKEVEWQEVFIIEDLIYFSVYLIFNVSFMISIFVRNIIIKKITSIISIFFSFIILIFSVTSLGFPAQDFSPLNGLMILFLIFPLIISYLYFEKKLK